MARARYKGENLYRTRITTDIPAISSTGNPLDVFQFDVVQAPTESKGWVFVDFTDTDSRDLIYYHAKSGNTLFYYRKDRDLLNNGSIAVTHPANDFVQINDVSQWIDYTFANLEDFGKIEDMGTNNAIIYGGSIWYNGSFQTISDTGLNALADGTWYAVFDYTDGSLKFIPSLTGFVGIRLAAVIVSGGEITSITDNRGIEGHTQIDTAFFAYNGGKLVIADGAINTVQIADGAITETKLATNSVSNTKIQNNAVTETKIADNSISNAKMQDNSVNTAELVNDSVTNPKIANDAVTETKIADNSVSTNKIQDLAITMQKLVNSGVSAGTYGDGATIPVITVDAKGRITGVTLVSVAGAPGAPGPSIANWATGQAYTVGTYVRQYNILFRCINNHTSGTFETDIANWQFIENITSWGSGRVYQVGQYVNETNTLYVCNTQHVAGGTFSGDIANWDIIGVDTTTVQTLTNKTIDANNNTISNIGAAEVIADIITGQTSEATNADNDVILIYDTSASALRSMTRANFLAGLFVTPLTTAGDIYYRDSGNADARLPVGTANKVLKSNGTVPTYGTFIKDGSTAAMAGTSITHVDADCTTSSRILWTASSPTNGFITVTANAGSITFQSTVAEVVSFTYTLIKN